MSKVEQLSVMDSLGPGTFRVQEKQASTLVLRVDDESCWKTRTEMLVCSFVKTNVCYLKLRSDLSETQKEEEQDKSGNPFCQLPRDEPGPSIEVVGYQLGPNLTYTFSGMHDTND